MTPPGDGTPLPGVAAPAPPTERDAHRRHRRARSGGQAAFSPALVPAQSATSRGSGAVRAARSKWVSIFGAARDLLECRHGYGDGRRGHDLAIGARTQ